MSKNVKQIQKMSSTYLADASVLDATIAILPLAGFSHSRGHRMVASSGQVFLLLGTADRRRLEAVYTLLLSVQTQSSDTNQMPPLQ